MDCLSRARLPLGRGVYLIAWCTRRRVLSLVIALVGAGACIVLSDTAPVSCVRVGVGRFLDPSSACVRRWWVPLGRFVAAGPGVAFLWLLVRVFCACVRGSLFPLSLFSVGRWLYQPLR